MFASRFGPPPFVTMPVAGFGTEAKVCSVGCLMLVMCASPMAILDLSWTMLALPPIVVR